MKTEEKIENLKEKLVDYIINRIDKNIILRNEEVEIIKALLEQNEDKDIKNSLQELRKVYKEMFQGEN